MARQLTTLVVDDSLTYRGILKRVVERLDGVELIGMAPNGRVALGKMGARVPDLVMLDVEMPEMDGLATLKQIHERYPRVDVVMVSGASRSNADLVMQCLEAGALDFVTKPVAGDPGMTAWDRLLADLAPIVRTVVAKRLLEPTRRASVEAPAVSGSAGPVVAPPRPPVVPARPAALARPDLIAIGASTGGPAALTRLLTDLGPGLPVPLLIVQHMPAVFTESLAAQLTRSTGIDVRQADHGDRLVPGRALLAPGGRHLRVEGDHVILDDGPKVNECRPAVDVLFGSLAQTFKGRVLSVVLTGMGRDGADGVAALKGVTKGSQGHACLVQDNATSVVYGMPRAVAERGLADEVLPLEVIGARIRGLIDGVRPGQVPRGHARARTLEVRP
ncbi:MAG: chemotaxis-specific protein-glutamate methyltransferase CheB [Gammaproteobacteria bacterium]